MTLNPDGSNGDRSQHLNAQALMDQLGYPEHYPLPGISVEYADPGCLDYYHIPRPK